MPTINDAMVVASAYDTSGNGGRKLVRLSNGWLIAVVYDSTGTGSGSRLVFYKSTDNGATWSILCFAGNTRLNLYSITNIGTRIYLISMTGNTTIQHSNFDATIVTSSTDVCALNGGNLDSSQTSFSGGSLIANDTGTELHATWASKNATYSQLIQHPLRQRND
jgi:hypothetical protein